MGILSWIIFGALTGWVASMLIGRNDQMGCLANIFIGIVGALVGGFLMSFLGSFGVTGFNIRSLVVAVIGAILFLGITGWRKLESNRA